MYRKVRHDGNFLPFRVDLNLRTVESLQSRRAKALFRPMNYKRQLGDTAPS